MHSFRKALLSCSVMVGALMPAGTAVAQVRSFDIAAQPASRAVAEFGRQSGLQIIVSGAALRGLTTRSIKGEHDARNALRRMMDGTGLTVTSDDGRTITLGREQASGLRTAVSVDSEIVVTGSRLQNRRSGTRWNGCPASRSRRTRPKPGS